MIEILGEPRQPLDGRRQAVLREPCLVRDSGIPGLVPASGSQAGYRVPEISPRHSLDQNRFLVNFIFRDFSYLDSIAFITHHFPRPVKL